MKIIAITRAVPAALAECELTYQTRVPIDVGRARRQHAEYQRVLQQHGYDVIELPEAPELADSVFVEDAAIVLDECAVITRPGAASRRPEVPTIRAALAPFRVLHEIREPATLDGGDVLILGRSIFVGLSKRTNRAAVEQLREIVRGFDYEVIPVPIDGALHLKSAITAAADELVVIAAGTVDPAVFGKPYIEVDAEAANMLRLHDVVLCPPPAAHYIPQLAAEGINVQVVDNSELAKAEGGLTCCSLIFASA
ncbi:MAG TPA: arginine deiminase family protein [Longimicrobiales bacterium]|nr:arginine deiminase family protein [Longimicrobiales bacterium]